MAEKNIATYITSTGVEVTIHPISMIEWSEVTAAVEEEYKAEGRRLTPPVYQIKTITGDFTERPITPEMMEDENDPANNEENRAAWNEYTLAQAQMIAEQRRRQNVYMYLEGMSIAKDAHDRLMDAWLTRRRRYKLPVPEDIDERERLFLSTAVLVTLDDHKMVSEMIMRKSSVGAPAEKVESALKSFRHSLSVGDEPAGEATDGDTGADAVE